MNYRLKKIDFLSLMLLNGLLGFVIGIVWGFFAFIASLTTLDLTIILWGLVGWIIIVVGGLIGGAVQGFVIAFLYNAIAFLTGGLSVTLEEEHHKRR